MSKALREIKESLKLVDIVFVLLDARLPESSMNPRLKEIIENKPALILYTKSSLADQRELNKWLSHYNEIGLKGLKIDAITGLNINKIKEATLEILTEKLEREKRRGILPRAIRTMIIGIPNVGKSTLINTLSKKKAAKTGNTPGITKAQQWIKISEDFELLDTPGVLWPKFDDPTTGYHLALSGAIKDSVLPNEEVAVYAHRFLSEYYPEAYKKRYELTELSDVATTFEMIGRKRGTLVKGNQVNYDLVYDILLKDLRDGAFGGITFDRFKSI